MLRPLRPHQWVKNVSVLAPGVFAQELFAPLLITHAAAASPCSVRHARALWISTLFVVLGVGRFLQLVVSRPKPERPTQEMLRDGPFVGIRLAWVGLVMRAVYRLEPGVF